MNLLYQITFKCGSCASERRITIPDDWPVDSLLWKLSNLLATKCPECGAAGGNWIIAGIRRAVTNK